MLGQVTAGNRRLNPVTFGAKARLRVSRNVNQKQSQDSATDSLIRDVDAPNSHLHTMLHYLPLFWAYIFLGK